MNGRGRRTLLAVLAGVAAGLAWQPFALWPLLPRALALPSPAQLRDANSVLERRVHERDEALGALDAESGWTADRWAEALDGYFADYEDIDDGPDARGPNLLLITRAPGIWRVRQILKDPEGNVVGLWETRTP